MVTAITRAISPNLCNCELEYFPRRPIDLALAKQQHLQYESCLRQLGAHVISLDAKPDLPDSVFVEDPAIVLDELAIICRMGAASRRPEADLLADALSSVRPLAYIEAPGTLEGGDVIRAGGDLFVGLSHRTNADGVRQLAGHLKDFDYVVRPVPVQSCLHLKSACCWLGDDAMLINREWVDAASFAPFRLIDVAPGEPWAANVLPLGGEVIGAAGFPETCSILERAGYQVRKVDMSELAKAEGAITCCSLVFES
jgi:dimethylargininase